jgi:hypothetical protein
MKLFLSAYLAMGGVNAKPNRDNKVQGRRYGQFNAMASFYNSNFDERTYWGYGCNCFTTSDRPLSDPGHGAPVDELDTVCQKYKLCAKCVKEEFGNQCVTELIEYNFSNSGSISCSDASNSCERALCECDKMFAYDLAYVDEETVDRDSYSYFYGNWDPEQNCVKAGGGGGGGNGKPNNGGPTNGGGGHKCCSNGETPFMFYQTRFKECCPNGQVAPIGTC